MKVLTNIFLAIVIMVMPHINLAQTATLYDSTGMHKGTFSKIADALAAAVYKDSIVLSAHTFYEHDITNGFPSSKSNILQGTISGKDTTIIHANGFEFCIKGFKGIIRDMVFTGVKPILRPFGGPLVGTPISGFQGVLGGNITIRDNIFASFALIQFSGNSILEGNFKIANNYDSTIYSPFMKAIFMLGDNYNVLKADPKTKIHIINNVSKFNEILLILGTSQIGDTSKAKATVLPENITIENNIGRRTGGILVQDGAFLELNNATIINNRFTDPNGAAAILVDTGSHPSAMPYDSIGVPYIRIRNSRIYNPLPDGSRQTEVRLQSRRSSFAKPNLAIFIQRAAGGAIAILQGFLKWIQVLILN